MPRAINPEGVLYLITSAIKIYKVAIITATLYF